MARKVCDGLKLAGIQASVKDGIATYDTLVLLQDFWASMDFFKNLPEEAKEKVLEEKREKKTRILHSWCEIFDGEDDVIVVDWHFDLKLCGKESLQNVLIIESKNNLPHRYNAIGKYFRGWIIFRTFPPLFIRVKL